MSESAAGGASPLRLLIDSNFYITLEPYGGAVESQQDAAAEVVRLAAEQGHRVVVHPATRDDLLEADDPALRRQRIAELGKYPVLDEGPVSAALLAELGTPPAGSNDERDLRILGALHNRAAGFLITNDNKLRKRAVRVGLGDQVLTIASALAMLRQLSPSEIPSPPRVQLIAPYALDADQDIFGSLRDDYAEFDQWLDQRVRPDHDNRDCLVIEEDGRYAALAIIKRHEPDCSYGLAQPVTKIATFKVNADYLGSKYGELLLKSIFAAAHARDANSLYVEVLPRHEGLVDMLSRFGFAALPSLTSRGEQVMAKALRPDPAAPDLSPLAHHIAYGPPAIAGTGNVFIVPIFPIWHGQLFPDAPADEPSYEQLELITGQPLVTHPWGNALRKAYLSNSPSNLLRPGDTLLFYQSGGQGTVASIGVVEDTLRSADPAEVTSFVIGRTVYTPTEIDDMCRSVRGVLAILFRQDRFIDPPWSLAELQANGVVRAWPQSITKVSERGAKWVHDQLVA